MITARLRRVVRVDVDVGDRQIGSPENAATLTLVQLDMNIELRLRNIIVGGLLVKLQRAPTVLANGKLAKLDIDAVGINFSARIANRRDQPSPVGITSRPGLSLIHI